MTVCGSATRAGGKCKQKAGWGTDHVGDGRCKLHGGLTPVKHGRYSRIKRDSIRDLIAAYAEDPDPLDLMPELAALRALFQDWIERYDEFTDALIAWHESFRTNDDVRKPMRVLDISDGYRLLSEVSRVVQRIESVKAQNAISRADLSRILMEMTRVVEMEISDDGAKERIKNGWQAIRLA